MRMRRPPTEFDERAERALEEEIRRVSGPEATGPRDPFWQNLLVRTNSRIDDVASGKGITISWAARVAIPGVVAILAFLVGLHYYAPELTAGRERLGDLVAALPHEVQDSLLEAYEIEGEPLTTIAEEDVFAISDERARDYFLQITDLATVAEILDDEQVSRVLTLLESSTQETPSVENGGGS